jgi:hypothetical protein
LNIGTPFAVPGVSEWQCGRFDLPILANNQVVTVSNIASKFSFGYIGANNSSNLMSCFGYLSQFAKISFPENTYLCENSSVVLDAGYAMSYDWTLPNGTHASTATILATDTGLYTVVINTDPFLVTTSTRVLHRFEGASIISSPASGRGAGTFTYTANHGLYSSQYLSYTWFVDGVQVSANSSFTNTWGAKDDKTIVLHIRDTVLNCTKIDTLHHLPSYIEVCEGISVTFKGRTSNGGSSPIYQWRKNGVNIAGANDSTYTYIPQNGDTISCLLVSNANCADPDSMLSHNIVVIVYQFPILPSEIIGDLTVCVGNTVQFSNATLGGVWSANNTGVSILNPLSNFVTITGVSEGKTYITYTLTNNGCETKKTVLLKVLPPTPPEIIIGVE